MNVSGGDTLEDIVQGLNGLQEVKLLPDAVDTAMKDLKEGQGVEHNIKTRDNGTVIMQLVTISEDKFIYNYINNDDVWYHLSKKPLHNKQMKVPLKPIIQTFIDNYNFLGRPNGIWCAPGNEWLRNVSEKREKFKMFDVCCYVYEVSSVGSFNLVSLHNTKDLLKFHADFADYWIDFNRLNEFTIGDLSNILIDVDFNVGVFYDRLIKRDIIITDVNKAQKLYPLKTKEELLRIKDINWHRVSKSFDGIFCQYSPSMVGIFYWFDSLDLTSACIWNSEKMRFQMNGIKSADDEWLVPWTDAIR
jgi:hypothetical protein